MIRKFLNYSLNDQGFTLAEGMVTAGLLGVVSLAMLQGLKQDSKTKAFSRISDDIMIIMGSINNNIKDNVSCSASLAGVTPVAKSVVPAPTGAGAVANIKDGDSSILLGTIPQYTDKTIAVGQLVGPGLTIATIRAVNFVTYFHMNDDLSDIALTTDIFKYGSIELEVRFTQSIGQEVAVTTERSILVNVRLNNAGAIDSCVNLADLTVLQLKQQICGVEVAGADGTTLVRVGSFVSATGECKNLKESLKSISAQKICTELGGTLDPTNNYKCLPVGSQATCPNGFREVINGTPKCL